MSASDWIALAALAVSAWAAWKSGRTSKRQQWVETQLREFQLRQIQAAKREAVTARIELLCYDSDHLTIHNAGGADARNVSVVCNCPNGESVFAVNESRLPIDRLAPGRTVAIPLGLTMGCYFPLPATVTWTDPDGTPREESVTLNLE